MSILDERPAALIEEVFGLLFAACELDSLSEQELEKYTRDMTTEVDQRNIIYCARMEGKEEGREEERRNTARNLKALGVDAETIVKATGLGEDVIRAL